MVIEEEFSKVLVVADRKDNTLSAILRSAWDGDDVLRSMTKNSPARATGAHISIIGHITREELRSKLTEAAAANGFGNRFLLPAVNRSKVLPEGGGSYGIADLVGHLKKAIAFARKTGELKRDEAARKLWAKIYPKLSVGKPGLLGAITARAEAHVLRLSDLYALLDCSAVVRVEHLLAALAVWKYCEDSARWIFETKTGNKQADRVLAALKVAGEKGLSKWEITSDVFNRNATRFEIDEALRILHTQKLAFRKEEKTSTKPAERWFYQAKTHEGYEESTRKDIEAEDTSYSSCTPASENVSSKIPDQQPAPPTAPPIVRDEKGVGRL
jgi:DNA replicative helicase MCM subunit Mcm2 (Cdc46/Mcm family)